MSFNAEAKGSAAKQIAHGFSRLALALRMQAWKKSSEIGVTPTQAEAVQHLSESGEGLRLGELASRLGISAPSASDTVSTLVVKGLVEKAEGRDKRSITIQSTQSGQSLASQSAEWIGFLAGEVEALDDAEQAVVLSALTKVIRGLQEKGFISPQRMCLTCEHFRPYAHSDAALPHHCAFVDAPFGTAGLRLNCADHALAPPGAIKRAAAAFQADRQ
jgi:DNA-binding MarR family transcriptional regulator